MTDEKLENSLNLALRVPEAERERSLDLNVGYDREEKTWDLIVKYTGNIKRLAAGAVQITELLGGYAVVTLPEDLVEPFSRQPEITYVEKPKGLTFAAAEGRRASCVNGLQTGTAGLFGAGIMIAVIDSGIDYRLEDFRNRDGTSRIAWLWDQTMDGNPPEGYGIGTEFSAEQINEALRTGNPLGTDGRDSGDPENHGTPVAAIAAGNGGSGGIQYRGMAPEAVLLIVRLGNRGDGFPRTTELLMGIDYAVRKMLETGMPMVINLSFGNSYGSHEGTSLLETYLDLVSGLGRLTICVGSGNEGAGFGHTAGQLQNPKEPSSAGSGQTGGTGQTSGSRPSGSPVENEGTETIRFTVGMYETGLNLQIWKSYVDEVRIYLVTPRGQRFGPFGQGQTTARYRTEETEIYVYYGEPIPYSTAQEIYLDLIPTETYVESGIYLLQLVPVKIVDGRYDLWLPGEAVRGRATRFLSPSPDTTLTIPSTAVRVITVGAYDSRYGSYADFSGRGYTRVTNQVKPDLAAPGVGIVTARAGGGYAPVTGTSFAVPFVSGAAALLMEWGIIRGNDPYLYGEKLKAYLRRGARPLAGFTVYPNPQVGFGALCVERSLP